MSIRLACEAFGLSESGYRYRSKLNAENDRIADWLVRLTDNQRNWGFGLCFLYLRNVKGHRWNHKRVYRIYCELELNLRIKPKKRMVLRDFRHEDQAISRVGTHLWWEAGGAVGDDDYSALDPAASFLALTPR